MIKDTCNLPQFNAGAQICHDCLGENGTIYCPKYGDSIFGPREDSEKPRSFIDREAILEEIFNRKE